MWYRQFLDALADLAESIGSTENAYAKWVRALARPLTETMPEKLQDYAVFPAVRTDLERTVEVITRVLETLRDKSEIAESMPASSRLAQVQELWWDASPEERWAIRNWFFHGPIGLNTAEEPQEDLREYLRTERRKLRRTSGATPKKVEEALEVLSEMVKD